MGWFSDTFGGGDLANFADNVTFQNGPEAFGSTVLDPFDLFKGEGIDDLIPKPDYSGPEGAAQKALDDEKKRRATEANRRDMQASQLARLFLSDNGAQEETFNFMGL